MIKARRAQLGLGDEFIAGFIAERAEDLWEPWMRQVDQALDDARLLEIIQDAWKRLCKKSKTRGRPGTPAEVILRLLVLKHIRDWSFEETAPDVTDFRAGDEIYGLFQQPIQTTVQTILVGHGEVDEL